MDASGPPRLSRRVVDAGATPPIVCCITRAKIGSGGLARSGNEKDTPMVVTTTKRSEGLRRSLVAGCVLASASMAGLTSAHAQFAIGTGPAADLYQMHCAACHGVDLGGGLGSALNDDSWAHGDSDAEIAAVIADGLPGGEMAGFSEVLSAPEIRSLVIYIQEAGLVARREAEGPPVSLNDAGVFETDLASYTVETLADVDAELWAVEQIGEETFLVTDKAGRLLRLDPDRLVHEIEGAPAVWDAGQGGLLDVGVHPSFEDTGLIYLSYAASRREGGARRGMTRVMRARLDGDALVDAEVIFQTRPEHDLPTRFHFGSRFVFADGYVFFSIGDRGEPEMSQDITRPNGKIFRLHDDGRVPDDNPFVGVPGAYEATWSLGHRNPQGLAADPVTGVLYATEHGPRGGDELNAPVAGANFGWPVVTFGKNYNGSPITHETSRPEFADPLLHWTPSIAACGLDVYRGDAFSAWSGDLLAGGLVTEEVRRIRIEDGVVTQDEIIVKGLGRVRDVRLGADGRILLVVNHGRGGASSVLRLSPASGAPVLQPQVTDTL